MKKTLKVGALTAICLMALSSAATAAPSKATMDFVKNAAIGNQFEISTSRLALDNSQNDDIKKFAQQMVDNHKQIGDGMNAALASPSVAIDPPANNLDAKHQAMLDALQKAPKANFDKLYIEDQVKAHDEAASLFNTYASRGDNDTLKTFAAQVLPVILSHQQHVEQLQKAN